jgi:uncharacterized repeat protein (TIGR03803 family)
MVRWDFGRYTLISCVVLALLVGCGVLRQAPDDMGQAQDGLPPLVGSDSANYKVIYSFGLDPDGHNPTAGLIDVGGTLYGTTLLGGSNYCSFTQPNSNCGTVYSVTTSGTEKILHDFGGNADGLFPFASLIDARGTLYGTTSGGGAGAGTVYSITTAGAEKVLYSFARRQDAAVPDARLIDVRGTLYGTTLLGGTPAFKRGTVFSVTTDGVEKILYSFQGRNGRDPGAGLIDVGGTLYGTTTHGGLNACTYRDSRESCGTVFSITTSGEHTVLHRFGGGADGRFPQASLVDVHGTLYGTTSEGGSYTCQMYYDGCGTVFSISRSGAEKVLHSFGKGNDGASPMASLIDVNGTLYGTTNRGGAHHCGTVFSLTTGGMEKVLHSFGKARDGCNPRANLTYVNGTLYGTTYNGGYWSEGTVFALTL